MSAQALAQALAAGDVCVDMRDRKLLLAHAAGVAPGRLVMLGAADFTQDLMHRYKGFLQRRAGGEPVSKIRGLRAFWMHDFITSPDVLDPRPETEVLVHTALQQPFQTVLDLGTGSGCILLSLLAERPLATGTGADLSAAALDVARRNADRLGVADRARLIRSDWLADVTGQFDLIVSNPPYIAAEEMAALPAEVRLFDPAMALTPGGDGLAPYRILAARAGDHLTPQGRMLLEIGWQQGADVAAILKAHDWRDIAVLPDLDGRDRVVAARKPA